MLPPSPLLLCHVSRWLVMPSPFTLYAFLCLRPPLRYRVVIIIHISTLRRSLFYAEIRWQFARDDEIIVYLVLPQSYIFATSPLGTYQSVRWFRYGFSHIAAIVSPSPEWFRSRLHAATGNAAAAGRRQRAIPRMALKKDTLIDIAPPCRRGLPRSTCPTCPCMPVCVCEGPIIVHVRPPPQRWGRWGMVSLCVQAVWYWQAGR